MNPVLLSSSKGKAEVQAAAASLYLDQNRIHYFTKVMKNIDQSGQG